MSKISKFQAPPPVSESDFEDLCLAIFRADWKDPQAKLHGRRGQRQDGVDIYSVQLKDQYGVQCKKVDHSSGKLNTDDMDEEIAKAKNFRPELKHFIFATTAKRNVATQAYARKLTLARQKKNLFSIDVMGWEDLVEKLNKHPEVFKDQYPEYFWSETKPIKPEDIENLAKREAFDAALDGIRDLLTQGKYKTAQELLQKLKSRIWNSCDNRIKFRLLTNLAVSQLQSLNIQVAANLFIEAHQYNSEDEKANLNLGRAYALLENKEKAQTILNQLLVRNPANDEARAMLISFQSVSSYEEALTLVPLEFRHLPTTARALSKVAVDFNQIDTALQWLENSRKALSHDPLFNAEYANLVAHRILQKHGRFSDGYKTPKLRDELKQAEIVLSEALKLLGNSDFFDVKAHVLGNRAILRRLLGDLPEAWADIELAASLSPQDIRFQELKAEIQFTREDYLAAEDTLLKIINKDPTIEARFLLCEVQKRLGKIDLAEKSLREIIDLNGSKNSLHDASVLLCDLLIQNSNIPAAAQELRKWENERDSEIAALTLHARIEKIKGNSAEATSYLQQAISKVKQTESHSDLLNLAGELVDNKNYDAAIELLESIQKKIPLGSSSIYLLKAYYFHHDYKKALALCEELNPNLTNKILSHLEIDIHEDLRNLKKAETTLRKYLSTNSSDSFGWIRLAAVLFRTKGSKEAIEILDSKVNFKDLDEKQIFSFTDLLKLCNRGDQALEILYNLQRENAGNAEAKKKLVYLFYTKSVNPPVEVNMVGLNCAVQLEHDDECKWYIIDAVKRNRPLAGELNPDNVLAKKLIGKKIGDEILVREDAFGSVSGKILKIEDKYVHVFRSIQENYGLQFPDDTDIRKIKLKGKISEQGVPEEIERIILNSAEKRAEAIKEILALYRKGNFTIGAFAKCLRITEIEAREIIIGDQHTNLISSTGSEEVLNNAKSNLAALETSVVLDVTSLLTAFHLGILEDLEKSGWTLICAQSTLDLIHSTILSRKIYEKDGLLSLSPIDGKVSGTFLSSEIIQEHLNSLKKLHEWILKNCQIQAIHPEAKKDRDRLEDILGSSASDSLVIARDNNTILYSDDGILRNIAKTEFKVEGCWTDAYLEYLRSKNLISSDKIAKAKALLISIKHVSIKFDDALLISSASASSFLIQEPFIKNAGMLSDSGLPLNAICEVIANFMIKIDDFVLPEHKKEILVHHLLSIATLVKPTDKILHTVNLRLATKLKLLPIQLIRLQNILYTWRKSHILR
ncbi:MAG: hypothetical protein JWQ35_1623 [Bacteriovoracaceae bacterium]|nr:hypothetical protein [Bacteriovoracaceae bacterium]